MNIRDYYNNNPQLNRSTARHHPHLAVYLVSLGNAYKHGATDIPWIPGRYNSILIFTQTPSIHLNYCTITKMMLMQSSSPMFPWTIHDTHIILDCAGSWPSPTNRQEQRLRFEALAICNLSYYSAGVWRPWSAGDLTRSTHDPCTGRNGADAG